MNRLFLPAFYLTFLTVFLWGKIPPAVQLSADSLTTLSAEHLYNYNIEAAQSLLEDTLKKNHYIRSIAIVDTLTGKQFVSARQPDRASESTQVLTREIRYRNEPIGKLIVNYSTTLVTLSPGEREWIMKHPSVRVGMLNLEPIAILKNGTISGMTGDYLDLISKRTGLHFETVVSPSWNDLFEKLDTGSIELIPFINKETVTGHGFSSRVYMHFPYVIVSRIKESFIDSLHELSGKKIAVPANSFSRLYLKKHYPRIRIIPAKGVIEALEMVKEGEAYAFVGHMAVGMYYVGNYYANTLHISGKVDHTLEHVMLAGPEGETLIAILNKALDSISPQEHQQIRNRWLHIEVKEAIDYTLIYSVGTLFLFIILVSLYWNRKLSAEIKERKEVEKKLAQAKQDAERANSAKSIFLANMSHEIRTPMNAIVGFTELLGDEVQNPRLRSYVQSIQNAGHTLLRLINDILDLSKIEAGKLELNYIPTDVRALCEEIRGVFELAARKKGITLVMDIDRNLPHYLLIDEIRLRQILLNLVGNAVKFTESGYVRLAVRSQPSPTDPSGEDITIVIEDTGIGIPSDQIETVFGAFAQTHGQDSRKYGGTGLGLSISRRLCEMMGGKIAVESTEGEGSAFTVHFPHVAVVSDYVPAVVPNTPEVDTFDPATILVVDDVANNREFLVKIFEKSEIKVLTAHNGEEAVELFERERPDLVLMDLRMPRMDGYEATRRIKAIAPKTPVIALTASVIQQGRRNDIRFDGFLGKPIDRNVLLSQLGRFLSHRSSPPNMAASQKHTLEWDSDSQGRFDAMHPSDRSELTGAYRRAVGSNAIHDIEAFAHTVQQLGERYAIVPFRELAVDLDEALASFDITRMEQLLKGCETIIVPRNNKEK